MNALIFAILTCTAGSGGVCLDNYPIRFHSAQDCLSFLSHNLAHGHELTNGRAYANGSQSVWFECDQKPVPEWQTIQPQPTPPERKSYTIATCFKYEADARKAAGPGNWHPGDAPCIQMLPAVHEDGPSCLMELAKLVAPDGLFTIARVDNEARVYRTGTSHDMWMQCYDTGK